eukprot:Nk52_evm12s1810 gene=Nk52_evmTU12s1810
MGVQGLWKLLQPAGNTVLLEDCRHKVLAVDASIWLHQYSAASRDVEGRPKPNGMLLGFFLRICKLLFYNIRPVFVFDGPPPALKLRVMERRRKRKAQAKDGVSKLAEKILMNELKSRAVSEVKKSQNKGASTSSSQPFRLPNSAREEKDVFDLPALDRELAVSSSSSESEEEGEVKESITYEVSGFGQDLAKVDVMSEDFNALPPDIQLEIMMQIQEQKRVASWDRITEMEQQYGEPKNFSQFQLENLLKSNKVTVKLNEVKELVNDQNNLSGGGSSQMIASSSNKRFMLFKDLKNDKRVKTTSRGGMSSVGKPKVKVAEPEFWQRLAVKPDMSATKLREENVASSSSSSSSEDECGQLFYSVRPSQEPCSILEKSPKEKAIQNLSSLPSLSSTVDVGVVESSSSDDEDAPVIIGNGSKAQGNATVSLIHDTRESPVAIDIKDKVDMGSDSDAEVVSVDLEQILDPPEKKKLHDTMVIPSSTDEEDRASNGGVLELEHERSRIVENTSSDDLKSSGNLEESNEQRKENLSAKEQEENVPEEDIQQLKEMGTKMSVGEVLSHLQEERELLESAIAAKERETGNISEEMCKEAQALLRLFGIPYISSPGEAEAQCAFLEQENLVDGTLTEDSDIFLFGSKRVYKNIFAKNRDAQVYCMDTIINTMGLTREKLVELSMYCGCDYTEGIPGIGVVGGLELLTEFPSENRPFEGLYRFRSWVEGLKKGGKGALPGKSSALKMVRRNAMNLEFPPEFPDERVHNAFFNPSLDKCKDKFEWTMPNVNELKKFAIKRFGWSSEKVDSTVDPIINGLNLSDQPTVSDYFRKTTVISKQDKVFLGSKRLENAMSKSAKMVADKQSLNRPGPDSEKYHTDTTSSE